jgi:transcriptional regulator GlxA family with amidase domain
MLARADVADVLTVGTRPRDIVMRPALRVRPDLNAAEFDRRFPAGADYVIVPAVAKSGDPILLAWIAAQARKGGTIVSICDGALAVANAGLLKGHRATAHWTTRDLRRKTYPQMHWVENTRYVADGRLVSSAGISAAIPTSLALIEAIAGHAKAVEVAQQVATPDWSPKNNSEVFHPELGRNLSGFAAAYVVDPWFHQAQVIGVPVSTGSTRSALR